MRNLILSVTVLFLTTGLGHAATIDLNDGSSLQGDIIKKDDKSIQVNIDGITMTYYADEIKDIDGQPFTPTQAVPAPVATPEAQPAVAAEAPAPAPAAVAPENPSQDLTQQPAAPAVAASSAEIDPAKRALILQFIDVFGTRQALNNNFEMMIGQIEKTKPEEAQKIRDRVKVNEIIDRLIPIYDRNFTTDDLKAFIAFYSSDEGQKLIRTIPEIMKESIQESIKYMQEKFPEIKNAQQ